MDDKARVLARVAEHQCWPAHHGGQSTGASKSRRAAVEGAGEPFRDAIAATRRSAGPWTHAGAATGAHWDTLCAECVRARACVRCNGLLGLGRPFLASSFGGEDGGGGAGGIADGPCLPWIAALVPRAAAKRHAAARGLSRARRATPGIAALVFAVVQPHSKRACAFDVGVHQLRAACWSGAGGLRKILAARAH